MYRYKNWSSDLSVGSSVSPLDPYQVSSIISSSPLFQNPQYFPSTHLASVSGTISLTQNAFSQLFLPLPVIPSFLCLAPISEDLTPHAHSSSPTLNIRSSLVKPSPASPAKASCFPLCVPRARSVFIHLFSTDQSKDRTSQAAQG